MACLSKLDSQLKDLEEKLKYILIIQKIRRVLRDKKPRKAWVREIYKNRSASGELLPPEFLPSSLPYLDKQTILINKQKPNIEKTSTS